MHKNKTKIVCTIGPSSNNKNVIEKMLIAGMNVARLNYSHGDFNSHAQTIEILRNSARNTGRRLAILGDLPGPKMRIGEIEQEPVELAIGDIITLTPEEIIGSSTRVSVSLPDLAKSVNRGDKLFLNDGMISLKVLDTRGADVRCEVRAGGELRSRKGLNLPGIDLGISAFTPEDQKFLEFSSQQGIDAVSQSFVSRAEDLVAVREAALALHYHPFLVAKIERMEALSQYDKILEVADGVMVARGDLGVEIPIARIATVQKSLIRKANAKGKPVINATQMLESMTEHRRPTRAEATDVANAILDGTDAVMLSGESAMGRFPVESVRMLAEIASEIEPHMNRRIHKEYKLSKSSNTELIARSVKQTVTHAQPAAVIVPTRSGMTARNITRYRLRVWVTAFSTEESTCQALQFSYGVDPIKLEHEPEDWQAFSRIFLADKGLKKGRVILTQGPSREKPEASYSMEIFEL